MDKDIIEEKDTLARLIRRCNYYKQKVEFGKYNFAIEE